MKKIFYLDTSPIYKDKYIIRFNIESLPNINNNSCFPNGTKGSYNVFVSKIMNLSYPDYLRYARDRLDAELIGKNSFYIIPYFNKTKTVDAFVKLLNDRMNFILHEREHPYEYITKENGDVEIKEFK